MAKNSVILAENGVAQEPKNEKSRAGAPKKYKTAKSLRAAVDKYFRSISAKVPVGGLDGNPILNEDGEPVVKTEYVIPPQIPAMCLQIGITDRTWRRYCDHELHPEFEDVTEEAMLRFKAYLVDQSLTRERGLQGVLFNLEVNHGCSRKQEIELGEKTRSVLPKVEMSIEEKLAVIAAAAKAAEEGGTDGEAEDD